MIGNLLSLSTMSLTSVKAEASSSRLPPPPSLSRALRRVRRRSSAFLLVTLLILLVLPFTTAKKSNLFPLKPVMGIKRTNSNAVGAADASAGAKSPGGLRLMTNDGLVVQPRKEKVVAKAAIPVEPATNPTQPGTKLKPRQQPAATAQMGRRKKKDNIPKEKKDYSSFLCPGGSIACPIPPANADATISAAQIKTLESQLSSLADWFRIGFECSEVDSDVENCGACVSLGQG